MSHHEQFTYNEEYDHTLPQVIPKDRPINLIPSDSEDDSPRPINYFCSSSSSSESEDDEENYFERFTKPEEFLECNRNDDEDDLIIPLETEDCDFTNVELDSFGQMSCPTCSTIFKSKIRFIIHKRRHFAIDHFMCPVCQKGFTKLEQCQAHEYKEHKEAQDDDNSGSIFPRYHFRTRNARKSTNYGEEFNVDEDDLVSIVPSTCLYPYDGPAVTDLYQAYRIEVKYGRNERKSHSKIQSKYALECQKRNKQMVEHKLAMVQARQDRIKRMNMQRKTLQNKQVKVVRVSNEDENKTTRASRTAMAHLASAPRRQALHVKNDTKGPRCYFCSLCGFQCEDKKGIEYHQDDAHPDVPVSELIQFLHVDKKKDKKRNEEPGTKESAKKMRLREKQTPAQIARAKKLEKKERLKEAKLFRNRRHNARIWEKNTASPTLDEFAFAIGLNRKTDVFLGQRDNHQSFVTSKLLRIQNREVIPIPGENKFIRIVMNRMPSGGNSRFFCCQHCKYYAASKTDIWRHRRAEHFKSLRQTRMSDETLPKVPEESDKNSLKRRCKVVRSLGDPFAAELHVQLDDISLSMGLMSRTVNRTESISQPPRKKLKIS